VKAIIPFKKTNAKSRLSGILSVEEREKFAMEMLKDVLKVLLEYGIDTTVISTEKLDFDLPGIEKVVDNRNLNECINDLIKKMNTPLFIVMSDIPLIQKRHLEEMVKMDKDVVIAPGRGGGTNVLFLRNPSRFRVDFYGTSFLDHIKIADSRNLSVGIYDSFFLSVDIDEVEDLAELLIHGKRLSSEYIKSVGISLRIREGRVGISRSKSRSCLNHE